MTRNMTPRTYVPPQITSLGKIHALTNSTFHVSEGLETTTSNFGEPNCPDYGLWINLTTTPLVVSGSSPWPGTGFECYVPN